MISGLLDWQDKNTWFSKYITIYIYIYIDVYLSKLMHLSRSVPSKKHIVIYCCPIHSSSGKKNMTLQVIWCLPFKDYTCKIVIIILKWIYSKIHVSVLVCYDLHTIYLCVIPLNSIWDWLWKDFGHWTFHLIQAIGREEFVENSHWNIQNTCGGKIWWD